MQNVFALQAAARANAHQSVGALIVTADDITQALTQWDATAVGVDQAVQACTTLDAATRAEWATFYAGYQVFSAANKNHFFFALGLPEISDQVIVYEQQISAWGATIKSKCANDVQPVPTSQDVIAQNNAALPGATQAVTSVTSSVSKLIAIAGVVFLAIEFAPMIAKRLT